MTLGVWTSVGNTQTCAAFRYTFAGLLECASVILPADAEYQQAGSLDCLVVALHYTFGSMQGSGCWCKLQATVCVDDKVEQIAFGSANSMGRHVCLIDYGQSMGLGINRQS